jgi:hypothetical protein
MLTVVGCQPVGLGSFKWCRTAFSDTQAVRRAPCPSAAQLGKADQDGTPLALLAERCRFGAMGAVPMGRMVIKQSGLSIRTTVLVRTIPINTASLLAPNQSVRQHAWYIHTTQATTPSGRQPPNPHIGVRIPGPQARPFRGKAFFHDDPSYSPLGDPILSQVRAHTKPRSTAVRVILDDMRRRCRLAVRFGSGRAIAAPQIGARPNGVLRNGSAVNADQPESWTLGMRTSRSGTIFSFRTCSCGCRGPIGHGCVIGYEGEFHEVDLERRAEYAARDRPPRWRPRGRPAAGPRSVLPA